MAAETVCPRCGYKNSFIKGFLPGTCVCRICQSQLDWREIPGAGEDCGAREAADAHAASSGEGGRSEGAQGSRDA
jgi:hypothetical protein